MAYLGVAGAIPIGCVMPWLKSFTNTPTLSQEFVEGNGQVLSDAQSPLNGQTIPNFNTATQRFSRGSSTSGTTGGSATHTHGIGTQDDSATGIRLGGNSLCILAITPYLLATASVDPSFYEVVRTMRVK